MLFSFASDELQALAAKLLADFPGRVLTEVAVIATESWSAAWDEASPRIATETFVVLGVGEVEPDESAGTRTPLFVGAGTAFGTGRHATTKVCLEMLEALPPPAPGARLLDVGTGTGILLVAAAHLGFDHLIGTEIDDVVLTEARFNLGHNGTHAQLLNCEEPPASLGPFDVVLANILVPVLHQLLPRLAVLLAPQGVLLLAGFVDKEAGMLLSTAEQHGLVLQRRRECRGWVGLQLGHRRSTPR